ncbi:hypothetical protein GGQ83_002608 [Roseococcus suduntuyensis]|uniref:Uncharacterized protein n=1 Tax=Roseococcus suduntuyensis TaxID=455361 RepID=A0A840AFB9_9PROT|nr:hypothetical protein [Roseococcus suduntuyensis]
MPTLPRKDFANFIAWPHVLIAIGTGLLTRIAPATP